MREPRRPGVYCPTCGAYLGDARELVGRGEWVHCGKRLIVEDQARERARSA